MEEAVKKQEPDELHSMLQMQFEEYEDASTDSRALARKCRAYKDGNQWTEDERATLTKRKQPCITDNKVQDKCNTLVGLEKRQRTDPKAYPRNPSPDDEQSAEAATDALRFIADQNNYQRSVRKRAAENLVIEGLCAAEVTVDRKRKMKVCIEHIRWDRVFYDPRSLTEDFENKTYCGYFTWMDLSAAKAEFKTEAQHKLLEESMTGVNESTSEEDFDDKPRRYAFKQGKRQRIQIFTHYFIHEGVWHFATWCKAGFLDAPVPSTYRDENGEPQCCIEIQALYMDGDGNPYGEVPRYLDLQDEHNKRRSKMLHLVNSKRLTAPKGAFPDDPEGGAGSGIAKARREMHKPDGVIEYVAGMGVVKIDDNMNAAEGQWRLLQQTDAALSQTGPNAALAGMSGDISGRAKQIDQISGALPLTPLFDALEAWEMRLYRQAWCRVKQFWTAETWIRVTDDEQKLRWVGLNQPVTQADEAAMQLRNQPEFQQMPPEEQRALVEQMAAHPAAQEPMLGPDGRPKLKNSVAEMDVDIIIDRGEDTVTVQQEEFAKLMEVAKGRPEVPFALLLEISQLRPTTKKRALEMITGANDPAAAQQAQFQQMMQQLQAMLMEANVRKTNATAAKDEAAAQESAVDASVKVAQFTDPASQVDTEAQVSVQ